MKDKRRHVRVRANATVVLNDKFASLIGGSHIIDISEGGISLPSKEYIPVKTIIEMEIRSGDLKEPIKVSARVVRIVSRDKGVFQFAVGLEFLDLNFAQWKLLHHLIQLSLARGEDQYVS